MVSNYVINLLEVHRQEKYLVVCRTSIQTTIAEQDLMMILAEKLSFV